MAVVEDHVKPTQFVTEEIIDNRPLWEIIMESGPEIPPEERVAAPHGGACHYKHYLYGQPKEV